jgi:ABC-type transport system substrate-binding protein
MTHPITGDRNFRLAVLHGINREDIATVAAGDWALGLTNQNGGDAMWGFATEFRVNDIPVPEFNQALAREYLAASVYNGEPIQVTASVSTNVKGAEMFQQQLAEIGINIVINETDTAGLNAQFRTPDHHIIFHGFTFTYAAGSSRHVFVPGGGQNRGNYDNPEVTQLITEALSMTDAAARQRNFERVQRPTASLVRGA